MNTKIIKFDLNKKLYEKIIAKQGDTKSRFLLFNLLDGAVPFNLTNRSVRVYGLKKDGTEIFNDLIVNNNTKGYCTLELTNQMLALAGEVQLELMIIEGDKKLTSNIFTLEVKKSINSEKAIVSTNEFTSLLNGLAALNEYDNYKNEIKEARGGQAKLKDRFDNIDSHLEQMAINVKRFGAKGDGVTDDTEAIKKAIVYASIKGNIKIYFPAGIYRITTGLKFNNDNFNRQSKIELYGDGNSSVIWLDSDIREPVVQFNMVNPIIHNLCIKGFKFNNNWSDDVDTISGYHGIEVIDCIYLAKIYNCSIYNVRANGISIRGTNNINIENNYIYDFFFEGILTSVNGENCFIFNNIIEGAGGSFATNGGKYGIDTNCCDSVIKSNIIKNVDIGITVENMDKDSKEYKMKNACLFNNILENIYSVGINISNTADETYLLDNVIIDGNYIELSGDKEIGGNGIKLYKAKNIIISNNNINNCTNKTGYSGYGCCVILNMVHNCIIKNNSMDTFRSKAISLFENISNPTISNTSIKIIGNIIKNGSKALQTNTDKIDGFVFMNNYIENCNTGILFAYVNYGVFPVKNSNIQDNIYVNTTNEIVSDGGSFEAKQNNVQLKSLILNNGVGTCNYFLKNNYVNINATITGINTANLLFTLPVNYRPLYEMYFTIPYNENNTLSYKTLKIKRDGTLAILGDATTLVGTLYINIMLPVY